MEYELFKINMDVETGAFNNLLLFRHAEQPNSYVRVCEAFAVFPIKTAVATIKYNTQYCKLDIPWVFNSSYRLAGVQGFLDSWCFVDSWEVTCGGTNLR